MSGFGFGGRSGAICMKSTQWTSHPAVISSSLALLAFHITPNRKCAWGPQGYASWEHEIVYWYSGTAWGDTAWGGMGLHAISRNRPHTHTVLFRTHS